MKKTLRFKRLQRSALVTGLSLGLSGMIAGGFGVPMAYAAGTGQTSGGTAVASDLNLNQLSQDEQRILEIFQYIHQYHMDPVKADTLTQGAIDGMLQATGDPFSEYFTDQEYQQFIDSLNQTFVGIGVEIKLDGDHVAVSKTIANGPAEQAGIKAGDLFVAINGQDIQEKSLDEVRNLLLGKAGTKVSVSVQRGAQDRPLTFTVTRSQIQLPTVVSKLTPEHLGYIQLADFSETAASEFIQALKRLEDQGAKGFIIDLRGNPGGVLQQAVKIEDQFVKSGVLLKTAESDGTSQTFAADGSGSALTQPIVILVDQNSASASEALSGSLQALHRATLIGTRTFGKGTMQIGIPMETGGVLKLTIGKYYLPDGFNPNHTGIRPDIRIEYPDLQYNEAVQLLDPQRQQILQYPLDSALASPSHAVNPSASSAVAAKGDSTSASHIVSADVYATLNGVSVQAPPVWKHGGYTYVPLRFTLEAFGWQVGWDGQSRTIACGTGANQRLLTNTTYTFEGLTKNLQHPLLVNGDSTYISLDDLRGVFPFVYKTIGNMVAIGQ
ncbi:S41 family peptidase [Fodinisporobacter ferrooxydans]|uniref:S41 family peptidase n=1 Tax=Fodinisporobacter ferrooxydans TaxID=2901836 RepID=A0ABY4CLR6_9BACL|nr:S41 family peptidase [Alicyclobacillaceae bacterium MYW30-H2]